MTRQDRIALMAAIVFAGRDNVSAKWAVQEATLIEDLVARNAPADPPPMGNNAG